MRAWGSSPLTRGKPSYRHGIPRVTGLIPAHAGKTSGPGVATTVGRAHPRSRGENPIEPLNEEAEAGSSPLTRGKPCPWRPGSRPGRLIPAHAGKTWSPPTTPEPMWAHPRSRGENWRRSRPRSRPRGSSPLTRGKPSVRVRRGGGPRLIPAHAGKTATCPYSESLAWAHPRSRGENR